MTRYSNTLSPEPDPEPIIEETEVDEMEEAPVEEGTVPLPQSLSDFLQTIGGPFKHASKPRNWLGNGVVEFVFFLHIKIK